MKENKELFFNWVLTLEFPACGWIFFRFTRPCSNLMFAWSHYFICLETKQFLFLLYPTDTKSPSLLFSHMVISTYIIKRLVSLVPHTQYAESSFLDFSSYITSIMRISGDIWVYELKSLTIQNHLQILLK